MTLFSGSQLRKGNYRVALISSRRGRREKEFNDGIRQVTEGAKIRVFGIRRLRKRKASRCSYSFFFFGFPYKSKLRAAAPWKISLQANEF